MYAVEWRQNKEGGAEHSLGCGDKRKEVEDGRIRWSELESGR